MTVSKALVKIILLVGLVLLGIGTYKRNLLPSPNQIVAEALVEPAQTDKPKKPFSTTVKKVEYTIAPVADYELRGVVVSRHDSASFWDVLHGEWNDHINVADLCIVWGNNLRSGVYRDVNYHNGQFTCNYSMSSQEVYARFNEDELSFKCVVCWPVTVTKPVVSLIVAPVLLELIEVTVPVKPFLCLMFKC
jgi:hypothetical protein